MKFAFDLHLHSCLLPQTMFHRLGTPFFHILGRTEFALRKFSASGCEFTRFQRGGRQFRMLFSRKVVRP